LVEVEMAERGMTGRGSEMAGLRGEKTEEEGDFCSLVLFWPREGRGYGFFCEGEQDLPG
jgi:hypothetical protein